MDEMMVCILNFDPEGFTHEKGNDEMQRLSLQSKQFIEDKFQITLSLSSSRIHEGLPGIPAAFREAMDAMEYRIIKGSGSVLRYDDIKNPNRFYNFSIDTEQKFINCIKAGDIEKASNILNHVFDDNFTNTAPSIEFARCLMFDLIGSMLKALDGEENAAFLETLDPVKRLSKCESVDAMRNEINTVLREVAQYVQESKQDGKNQIGSRVLAFIQENHMDVNLCVSMIGSEFGLTAAYLSKIFKEQTRTSIMDAINKVSGKI